MTEIPMTGGGTTSGARPKEVTYAGYLILLESLVGLIIGGVEYVLWDNEGSVELITFSTLQVVESFNVMQNYLE